MYIQASFRIFSWCGLVCCQKKCGMIKMGKNHIPTPLHFATKYGNSNSIEKLKREIQNVQMKPTNYLKFSLTVFFFVILTNKFIYSENQIYFRVKWKYLGKGQLQSKEDVLSVKWQEDLWGHPKWNSPKLNFLKQLLIGFDHIVLWRLTCNNLVHLQRSKSDA